MKRYSNESGQVLLIGVVMIIILLVVAFILADVHNTIRAKLKVENAQQAAALAAAEWQRESLNLIGEINLIKASTALLQPPEQSHITQQNYDRLTEMQTRISFIGPLIAFAAAQQTAKANGINSHGDLSKLYLEQLTEDNGFYFPPGSDGSINNYFWFHPYRSLVETISMNGIAVRPNASGQFGLTAYPTCLNSPSFYNEIYLHKSNIDSKPKYQRSWSGIVEIMSKKPDSYYKQVWWDIQFHSSAFIGQSEIYPLYVNSETNLDYSAPEIQEVLEKSPIQGKLLPPQNQTPELQNIMLKWFCYDWKHWDIETYRQTFMKGEDDYHHQNWYNGDYVLRSPIKEQFRYEGPIAYAETGLKVSHLSKYVTPSTKYKRGNFELFKNNTPLDSATVIGSERIVYPEKDLDLTDRPGAIAKTFGELKNNKPPHTVRMVLPVFHTSSIVPTFFPQPYDFAVLREISNLERFLIWLSKQTDLNGIPPQGLDWYLEALRILTDGPGFRYYCWNPNFDADAFNAKWKTKWHEYYEQRESHPEKMVYNKEQNPTGPGWCQEPRLYTPLRERNIRAKKIRIENCRQHKEKQVLLVGVAYKTFYVIEDGKIITNDDHDPLQELYGNTFEGSGGNNFYVSNEYNAKPAPPRL